MERLTYWCDNGHGGGKWFVAIDAEGGEDYGPHVDRLRELDQAHKENRVLPEGSGWFVTCSGKKLTVVMDIEAALRREQDG